MKTKELTNEEQRQLDVIETNNTIASLEKQLRYVTKNSDERIKYLESNIDEIIEIIIRDSKPTEEMLLNIYRVYQSTKIYDKYVKKTK